MLFHVRTDAYTEINVGMSIGILILEAMISKSTIEMLASVDEQHILTVRDLVEETFEYPFQFQIPLSSLPMGKFTVDALRQLINSLGAKASVKNAILTVFDIHLPSHTCVPTAIFSP